MDRQVNFSSLLLSLKRSSPSVSADTALSFRLTVVSLGAPVSLSLSDDDLWLKKVRWPRIHRPSNIIITDGYEVVATSFFRSPSTFLTTLLFILASILLLSLHIPWSREVFLGCCGTLGRAPASFNIKE